VFYNQFSQLHFHDLNTALSMEITLTIMVLKYSNTYTHE